MRNRFGHGKVIGLLWLITSLILMSAFSAEPPVNGPYREAPLAGAEVPQAARTKLRRTESMLRMDGAYRRNDERSATGRDQRPIAPLHPSMSARRTGAGLRSQASARLMSSGLSPDGSPACLASCRYSAPRHSFSVKPPIARLNVRCGGGMRSLRARPK